MIIFGKKKQKGMDQTLRYFSSIEDGVMALSTNAFMSGFELRGPDIATMDVPEVWAIANHIAESMALGSGWTVQTDHMRKECHDGYPEPCPWMPVASMLIDEERRNRFNFAGEFAPHTSKYYLSLTYQPPKPSKSDKWLFSEGGDEAEGLAQKDLEYFKSVIEQIGQALKSQLGRFPNTMVRPLRRREGESGEIFDDLCRYIRYCVTGHDHPFILPDYPIYMAGYFADDFTSGAVPRLGDKYIAVVTVDGFPTRTFAGAFAGIEGLRFPLRYTQQGRCMDSDVAVKYHGKNMDFWKKAEKSLLSKAKNDKVVTEANRNKHAEKNFAEAKEARDEAMYGGRVSVKYAAKVILMDEDKDRLERNAGQVRDVIRGLITVHEPDGDRCGFQTRRERQNVVGAWFSSLPGHADEEVREAHMTINNMTQLAPLSAPYLGEKVNPSELLPANTPPIMIGYTVGGNPYNLHLHIDRGGIGHTMIGGPSSAGKTTLMNALISQFPRLHPDARVFSIDKDKTQYTLVKSMGGVYYDLEPGTKIQFCPLYNIDTPEDRAAAGNYLRLLCGLSGVEVTHHHVNLIGEALNRLRHMTGRSLTHFIGQIGPHCPEVASALRMFTEESAQSGGILDGERDLIAENNICAFEVGKLYENDPKITVAVLFHIFTKMRKSLNPARPTLLAVDELSNSLDIPEAAKFLGDFLVSVRKMNMTMVLAIQELGKVVSSSLGATAIRECRNRIFLPNPSAGSEIEGPAYSAFGCTKRDIQIISNATPARDYYQITPSGRRLFSFDFGKVALTLLSRSKDEDRALLDRLHSRNPSGFVADFLRANGLKDWGNRYEELAFMKGEHPDVEEFENVHSIAAVGN